MYELDLTDITALYNQLIINANYYFQNKEFDQALIELKKIENYQKNNPNFLELLADTYMGMGKFYDAIDYYLKAIKLAESNGLEQHILEQRSEAEFSRTYLKDSEQFSLSVEQQWTHYFVKEELKKTTSVYNTVELALLYEKLCKAYIATEQMSEAYKAPDKYLKNFPINPLMLTIKAEIAVQIARFHKINQQLTEAFKYYKLGISGFEKAVEIKWDFIRPLIGLIDIYQEMKMPSQLIKWIQIAITACSDNETLVGFYTLLNKVYFANEEYIYAHDAIKSALKYEALNTDYLCLQAEIAKIIGDKKKEENAEIESQNYYNQCISAFGRAVAYDPAQKRPYKGLINHYKTLRDYPKAIEWLQKMIFYCRNNEAELTELHYELSKVLRMEEHYIDAYGAIDCALAHDQDNCKFLWLKAEILERLGDLEQENSLSPMPTYYLKAIETYRKLIKAYKKFFDKAEYDVQIADAYSQMHLLYLELDEIPKAMFAIDEAIKNDPKNAELFLAKGLLLKDEYERTKSRSIADELYAETVKNLKIALSIDNLQDAYLNLAMLYCQRKHYQAAYDICEQAERNNISNADLEDIKNDCKCKFANKILAPRAFNSIFNSVNELKRKREQFEDKENEQLEPPNKKTSLPRQ